MHPYITLKFAEVFFFPAESTEIRRKFDFLHNYKSAVILSRFRAVFITSESHEEAGQGTHSTRIAVLAEDDKKIPQNTGTNTDPRSAVLG